MTEAAEEKVKRFVGLMEQANKEKSDAIIAMKNAEQKMLTAKNERAHTERLVGELSVRAVAFKDAEKKFTDTLVESSIKNAVGKCVCVHIYISVCV